MNILVACENHQRLTTALRKAGHTAFSCDIKRCTGQHPEWHINDNCSGYLNGQCRFLTQSNDRYTLYAPWDMIFVFPPMGNLSYDPTRSTKRWWPTSKRETSCMADDERLYNRAVKASCPRIVIDATVHPKMECLVPHNYSIQPFMFLYPFEYPFLLYIKGVQPLCPTGFTRISKHYLNACSAKGKRVIRLNDLNYIIDAMVDQWTMVGSQPRVTNFPNALVSRETQEEL